MSSQRRIDASRANGARSRGPVTPEGKERSARNALRHGILARTVVLADESSDAFRNALAGYVRRFQPADDIELALVEEMVTSFWRQRRCWAIETRLMDDAVAASHSSDVLGSLAEAFTALAATPQLGLLHRYESRLHMMFQRALSTLRLLQETDPPNEPNPISEQSAAPPPEPAEAPETPAETPEDLPVAAAPAPEPPEPPQPAVWPEPDRIRRLLVDIDTFDIPSLLGRDTAK